MGIRQALKRKVGGYLITKFLDRLDLTDSKPDFVIKPDGSTTYMNRWYIIPRTKFFSIYGHQFVRSDEGFALHDHPWLFNISYVWEGGYEEEVFCIPPRTRTGYNPRLTMKVPLTEGTWKFRWGTSPHRVCLKPDGAGGEREVWTIFICGPVVRVWGFYCLHGWKPFDKVLNYISGVGSSKKESTRFNVCD